jgi:hypothetical protein
LYALRSADTFVSTNQFNTPNIFFMHKKIFTTLGFLLFLIEAQTQITFNTRLLPSGNFATRITNVQNLLNAYLDPTTSTNGSTIPLANRLKSTMTSNTKVLYKGFPESGTTTELLEAYVDQIFQSQRQTLMLSSKNSVKGQCSLINYDLCSNLKSFVCGTPSQINIFQRSVDSLSDFQLAKLVLYAIFIQDLTTARVSNVKVINVERKAKDYFTYDEVIQLARNMADLFEMAYNAQNQSAKESLCLDVENPGRMVPYYIYKATLQNDVSTIISGTEGKLGASKVDLKFTSPGIDFSIPLAKHKDTMSSLQLGGGINFKEAVTEILNRKPNYEGHLSLEYIKINNKVTKMKFDCREKEEMLLNMYSTYRNATKAGTDSIFLNATWRAKRIAFFTLFGNINAQRLNIIDDESSASKSKDIESHTKLNGTLSFNAHFYQYNNSERMLKYLGNKYAKAGIDLAYNNNVSIGDVTGIKVEEIEKDSTANVVLKEYVAYNKTDVIQSYFTINPHLDFYLMENSKHFGLHWRANYKMVFVNENNLKHYATYGIGFFGSVKNNLSKDGGIINFELLVSATNELNKNLNWTVLKSGFVPTLKMEFPFNQLKYKQDNY